MTHPAHKEWTYQEIAARIGIAVDTLRKIVSRKEIGCVRHGHRTVRITEEQFQRYLKSRTINPLTQ